MKNTKSPRLALDASGHPTPAAFWGSLERTPQGCWEWTRARNEKGYGRLGFPSASTRVAYAHRVAWVFAFGEIPDGQFVCHRCDNPPCCNPAHLFLGTNSDNQMDMVRKGRQWRRVSRDAMAAFMATRSRAEIIAAAREHGVSIRTVYRYRAAAWSSTEGVAA